MSQHIAMSSYLHIDSGGTAINFHFEIILPSLIREVEDASEGKCSPQ